MPSSIDFTKTADFDKAIAYCLQNEGKFVDIPMDRGGPTYSGITMGILQKYRQRPVSTNELKNLSLTDVKAIYEQFFWNPLKVSGLQQSIATAILDTAINQGQSAAIKLAQMSLSSYMVADGIMGPDTLKALDEMDPREFIYNYIRNIQEKYAKICMNAANQIIFIDGWLKRSTRLFTLIT